MTSLERIWINGTPDSNGDVVTSEMDREETQESVASSVSLGDTHIWRDNGEANV
jgi:hypothetical protein